MLLKVPDIAMVRASDVEVISLPFEGGISNSERKMLRYLSGP